MRNHGYTIPEKCDVLVIGSGAAGLTAASSAASLGLDVVVVETADRVGGATAWSGGWVWLPSDDDADLVKCHAYLEDTTGPQSEPAKITAFVQNAGALLKFLSEETLVRFQKDVSIPDYQQDAIGATMHGRSRVVAAMDGRVLGAHLGRLRAPLRVLTIAGLMPAAGSEMRHFFNATRSYQSFFYVCKRLLGHGMQLLQTGRRRTLTNGNALAGGLFKAALDLNVMVFTQTSAQSLIKKNGRVTGAILTTPIGTKEVSASRGVILASGGISGNSELQNKHYPHVEAGHSHKTMSPPEIQGDGLTMAILAGAKALSYGHGSAAWVPVSLIPTKQGTVQPFPHFADRAKPGLIAVRADGRRFGNEAAPYFDFIRDMCGADTSKAKPEAWLICDDRFITKYGLGYVRPFPFPKRRHLRSGYLQKSHNLANLAKACGIDAVALNETVKAHNKCAAVGTDPEFGRGASAIDLAHGDPSQKPNACVAPITLAPFFAVKVQVGCLGSFAGIHTDAQTRVLGNLGIPIPGLFACGADAASMMAGTYPAGGISLGPAMVFGHIAGRAIASA